MHNTLFSKETNCSYKPSPFLLFYVFFFFCGHLFRVVTHGIVCILKHFILFDFSVDSRFGRPNYGSCRSSFCFSWRWNWVLHKMFRCEWIILSICFISQYVTNGKLRIDSVSWPGFYSYVMQNPEFLTGRQAHIIYKGKKIGTFGIVHPEVATPLGNYL